MLRAFSAELGHSFGLGAASIFSLVFLEAMFQYRRSAALDLLLPPLLFAFSAYLLICITLPIWAALVAWLKHRFASNWFTERLCHGWSLIVLLLFLALIPLGGLTIPTYYILTVFLWFLLSSAFLVGNKRLNISHVVMLAIIAILIIREVDFHPKGTANEDAPNIILVVSDTTRADRMSFNGYRRATTPRMGELAKAGANFSNAHSPSSWTKPATAALLTSRFMTSDPVHHGPARIKYDGPTLAHELRRNGYQTALFSANSNASSYFGHADGYDYRVHSLPPAHFAVSRFVVVRFFQALFEGKTDLNLKNKQQSLDEYAAFLKLPMSKLGAYASGNYPSPTKLTRRQEKRLKNDIRELIIKKAKTELESFPRQHPRRDTFLYRYLQAAYDQITVFFFLHLQKADGEIRDHWIKDHDLTRTFTGWHQDVRDTSKPFFAHLQYMGPHTPYVMQPPYMLPHFSGKYEKGMNNPPTQHTPPSVPAPRLSTKKLQNLSDHYDDAIRITDANIGILVDYLREKGEWKNTLFIFVSDHGEAFYEHNIYGHMNSLHNEMVHVPLFFYWQNRIRAQQMNELVSLADVMPSVLTLVGLSSTLKKLSPQGMSLFSANGNVVSPQRQFTLPMATLVGGAWKTKKKDQRPFGIHTGILTSNGKLLHEREQNGDRFLFFPSGDTREERRPITPTKLASEPRLERMSKLLPPGPD